MLNKVTKTQRVNYNVRMELLQQKHPDMNHSKHTYWKVNTNKKENMYYNLAFGSLLKLVIFLDCYYINNKQRATFLVLCMNMVL